MKKYPNCYPIDPWEPKQNSGAVEELVVPQVTQTLPLFIIKMSPTEHPRTIVVEYDSKTSNMELNYENSFNRQYHTQLPTHSPSTPKKSVTYHGQSCDPHHTRNKDDPHYDSSVDHFGILS